MSNKSLKTTDSDQSISSKITIIRNRSFWVDLTQIAILITLIGLYAFLMVKDRVPLPGIALLCILWFFYWLLGKRLSFTTPLDLPVLCLLGLLPLSLINSVDMSLTLAKVYGLVLGGVTFYLIVNYTRNITRLQLPLLAILVLGLVTPVVGFFATDWTGSSFTLPSRILAFLGHFLPVVNKISAGGGIHVNTLGGTLTFLIPMLLSLLWDAGAIKRTYLDKKTHPETLILMLKITIGISLILSLTILVLTQSRGSYLGVAVGILAYIIWKNPRLYWLIPFLIVTVIAGFLVFGDGNLVKFISILDTSADGNTLLVRLDYWKRTVFMVQDFPFTGVGLGTYGKVFDGLYTFTPFSSGMQPSFYAHNMYLAVAASMGLPALILFFSLFSSCATMVISTYRKVRSLARILLMGLSCGILANLIYGLWDNYLLGEKLAIILWIYLGIITAIFVHQQKWKHRNSRDLTPTMDTPKQHLEKRNLNIWIRDVLFGFGTWVMFSLASIAFINTNAYISLAFAILGGILLGVLMVKRFKASFDRQVTHGSNQPKPEKSNELLVFLNHGNAESILGDTN